jgi:hypothetical protein
MSLTSGFPRRPAVSKPSLVWTLAIVSVGLFMTTLDNLVVTTALPSIRRSLGASIQSLEWTVNAYTLTFAVLCSPERRWGTGSGAGECSQSAWPCSPRQAPRRRSRPAPMR